MPKPYIPNDRLAIRAKRQGFRARSIFKLEELDQKFKLLKPNMVVLDLGAAPGSWLQYASKKIGIEGLAIGLDIKPITKIAGNVLTFEVDITDFNKVKETLSKFKLRRVDIILSDIAPNTTGIKYVDQKKSVELNQVIVNLSKDFLNPKGRLVMKVFPGEDFDNFLKDIRKHFKNVSVAKVEASRDRSREVYIICQ